MKEIAEKLFQEINKKDTKSNDVRLCRENILRFLEAITEALFYDYFGCDCEKDELETILHNSLNYLHRGFGDFTKEDEAKIQSFYEKLPELRKALLFDAKAIYEGDPASNNLEEIITTYPGFIAISVYRIAHVFYELGYRSLARIMSEHAHSKTGIDINAGAKIGPSFCIDHGTGIVIGETTQIGAHCKIYQGVTLGALSLKDGRKLHGVKRHPTIQDNVVIYSGASIFGGNTVIGNNVTIGSNVEITSSIPDNTVVTSQPNNIHKQK